MALPAQRHRSEKDWRSQFASIEAECDSLIKRYHSRFDAALEHDLLNWQNFRTWLARLRREIWQSYSVEESPLRSIIRDLLMADLATIPESVVRKLRALRLTNVELLKVVFEAEKWAGDCTFVRSPSECKPIFFNQEIFNVTKWTVPNDLVDDVLLQISRSNPHLVTLNHLKDIINCYNENVSKPYYQKRDIDIGRTIAIDVLLKVHRDLRRNEIFPSSSLVGCVITEVWRYLLCHKEFLSLKLRSPMILYHAIQTICQVLHQAKCTFYRHHRGYHGSDMEILSKAVPFLDL